ncbi:MAG: hypothetical protein ABIK09_13385 [Pseudomonadota bacterium]
MFDFLIRQEWNCTTGRLRFPRVVVLLPIPEEAAPELKEPPPRVDGNVDLVSPETGQEAASYGCIRGMQSESDQLSELCEGRIRRRLGQLWLARLPALLASITCELDLFPEAYRKTSTNPARVEEEVATPTQGPDEAVPTLLVEFHDHATLPHLVLPSISSVSYKHIGSPVALAAS